MTETLSDSSKPAQTSRESSQIQQNFVYKFGIHSHILKSFLARNKLCCPNKCFHTQKLLCL